MSRAFDRTLKSVKQQLLPKREPMPDFTGWNPADVVMWHLNNGESLEEMVKADRPRWEKELKKMEAKRERERRAAEGDARMEATIASSKPTPDPKPEPQAAEPQPPEPGMPKPEPQWWEERAHWRQRGPRDYEWEKPTPGRCLVEYDVLKRDNGYDPFRRNG
jgi:hypothetical protein